MLTGLRMAIRFRQQADLSGAIRQVTALLEEQQIEEDREDVRDQLAAARESLVRAADSVLHARLLAKNDDTAGVSSLRVRRA